MKKSKGKRKFFIWGLIGLAVIVLLSLAMAPRPVPADFGTIERGSLRVTLDHEGKTRVRDKFVVSAPVAGRVLRIVLEPGEPVIAGETVLAVFEPSDPSLLDARSRAEAEAGVRAAEASFKRAKSELLRAKAEREYAETELGRFSRLSKKKIVSDEALDAAQVRASMTTKALRASESAAKAAEHELEGARARVLEPVSGSNGKPGASFKLYSPITGVVLKRIRHSEAIVPMGEPLLEVADRADLEIIADYLSSDAVKIQQGMPVIIDQWGGDKELRGKIRRIEPSGFMKISALGVEEQRVWVVVDFDDPHDAWQALGDEYRVETRVIVWERTDVLKVPTSSLFRQDEGWAVFVVEENKASLRPVQLGRRNGLEAEVLGGLKESERVIVHPSDSIIDGVKVAERS